MSDLEPINPRAVVLGCAGPELSDAEAAFFREADPLGFILFKRNCDTPDQLRRLVADLRAAVGRDDAPVLIDQEGGRVVRLGPPHWRRPPAMAVFGALHARDPEAGREAAYLNARLLAADLAAHGITVNCAPVLDLPQPGSDRVIGDRALGADPDTVTVLGAAVIAGLMDGGVLPVIKHVPGHGRARVDSHVELPRVDAPLEVLDAHDFEPFRRLRDAPMAMTAHIVFQAVDPDRPATQSTRVIEEVVRDRIGFDGVLISDDLSMNALEGDLRTRAARAAAAGCDLLLHSNGLAGEMTAVADAAPRLTGNAWRRVEAAMARRAEPMALDRAAVLARLERLLG